MWMEELCILLLTSARNLIWYSRKLGLFLGTSLCFEGKISQADYQNEFLKSSRGLVRNITGVFVQIGPKLQSSVQILAQSKQYIHCGIHPPPTTTNFLKGSRPSRRLISVIWTSQISIIKWQGLFKFNKPLAPQKNDPFQKQNQNQSISKLSTLDLSLV